MSGNCELGRGLRSREKNATEGGAGRFEKPAPDARAAPPEAHESLIGRKTVEEVPLTGLSSAWAKLMARVGEEFPLACPVCGGDIRLIAFITEPGPIRKILTHLGEPLEPQPVSPARGPPTDWGELVQVHDECDVTQTSPDELPVIDIHAT
jgi:hypothetical protein